LICIFPFYFKAQSSNLALLGVKTRPWKFLGLSRKRAMIITCTFRAHDFKKKNRLSRQQAAENGWSKLYK